MLLEQRIPESWALPRPILEARALVRLYKDLLDERTGWLQRVHAGLFHMGAPDLNVKTMSAAGRERLAEAPLSPATRTAVDAAMRQVDRLTEEMALIRDQIEFVSRRQPACRALQAAHYGIGALTSVAIWAEMGDTRRFHSSDDAVRHAGLDVTVYSSNGRRAAEPDPAPPLARTETSPAPPAGPAVRSGHSRADSQTASHRESDPGPGAPPQRQHRLAHAGSPFQHRNHRHLTTLPFLRRGGQHRIQSVHLLGTAGEIAHRWRQQPRHRQRRRTGLGEHDRWIVPACTTDPATSPRILLPTSAPSATQPSLNPPAPAQRQPANYHPHGADP